MSSTQRSIFSGFALETTARDATQFFDTSLLPAYTQVKVAFLGNETFEQRLAALETLRASGADPMPIVSSRRLTSEATLESYLTQAIQKASIDSIFLVGGDPATPQGPFNDSLDLINSNALDRFAIGTVGIAGYPEGHPRVEDEVLWHYLKLKTEGLVARGFSVEITTQLSFNAEAVIRWIEKVRAAGIQVPIRVGIPSPSTLTGLLKFASQCRVSTSAGLLRQYGWQVTSLLKPLGPEGFVETLQAGIEQHQLGDVRLHLFPMGNLARTLKWVEQQRCSAS